MSLLDLLTGGKTSEAEDQLAQAQQDFSGIQAPTQAQLTLPQLQQYVQAGMMTPAQAQAVLQSGNAYNNINLNPAPVEAEQAALSQLQDIASSGGMDAEAKAALAEAANTTQENEQGQRGSIIDQMAARGIPTSLMSEALQSASAGQDAQTLSMTGEQAASDAEQRALAALQESGQLGGQMQTQQYGEAANKAAAQNAIAQWNAQNQTNVNTSNAANTQAANLYNTQTAQNVSNQNTEAANARTAYNTQVPQTTFQDQIQKAQGQSGVAANQASNSMQAGQQQAGLIGGILGAAGDVGASAAAPAPVVLGATGGLVPGDSPKNDVVPARLSPGEVVIPRSISMRPDAPDMAKQFVQHILRSKVPVKPVHPHDVRSVLDALTSRREGVS